MSSERKKKEKGKMKKVNIFLHSLLPTPYSPLPIFFFLLIAHCSLLSALDFNFRPKAFVSIPMGSGNTADGGGDRYSIGGGGELGFEIDLSTVWPNPIGLGYTFGLEGGMMFNPLQGDGSENVTFYSIGGVLGLYYFPFSRIFTRIDGAVGVYQAARAGEISNPGLAWRGSGEIGFRFTPGFTLAANVGWRQFQGKGNVLNSGLYAGLTAQLTFQTGANRNEGLGASFNQYETAYPAYMQLYQTSALGSAVIRNNENAEIRDVRVSFRASPYTASEFPCGAIPFIARGRSAELPLLAGFSPEILRFTDNGRILGELVIRYRFLGKEKEAVQTVIVATHNRNTTTGDVSALAAFISPTSPETLDFARYIAGLARTNRRTGHNWNFQCAIWIIEGLRAAGIKRAYTYSNENQVQFPAETMSYGTGNSRDLALLYAAVLEGVDIPVAFVKTENDFLLAFSLGVDMSAAETLFNGTDKILIVDKEVWLPLSMNAFNNGFTAAWTQATAVLNELFKTGNNADFVKVEEAWAVYPPAPLPELGGRAIRTNTEMATNSVNGAMTQYIEQELQQILAQVQRQINTNPTSALYNRVGILQARIGRISEAKTAYERAAGMGSVPAMTNRGNLALIERDYASAERWFRQALASDSQNQAAIRGLERVEGSK
jgi:tetratricopeptide (TPR) repeat protein